MQRCTAPFCCSRNRALLTKPCQIGCRHGLYNLLDYNFTELLEEKMAELMDGTKLAEDKTSIKVEVEALKRQD